MKTLKRIYHITLYCLTILFLSLTIYNISIYKKVNDKNHVFNVDMKIVSINGQSTYSNDKFHTPQQINIILFETIKEPKLYREIVYVHGNSNIINTDIHIDSKWLYNHKPGDIVHFDYLLKKEFFTIKKR